MIDSFRGDYRWLSNFHPVQIPWRGTTFRSVEHAYQASKCRKPSDVHLFLTCTAGEAKKRGRTVPCVDGWEEKKLGIMLDLLRIKFAAGTELSERLLKTGSEQLIEGNYWNDYFWGVCRGKGENHLGNLLMKVRDGLNGGGE
jgi:ribA/ribD-fused uncharacterized protein